MIAGWIRDSSCVRRREGQPPRRNWPVVLLFNLITVIALSIMTPSLFQFITLPRTPPTEEEAEGERFWPGLGESETFYAWAIMTFAIGEIMAVSFAGAMAERLPYTLTLILPSILFGIGGTLYGLAVEGWMVLLARLFFGFGSAFKVVVHAYLGEFGTQLDELRQKNGKRPLKYTVYIALSFVINGGFFVAFGVTSIVSQFPDVNPYHWPGWFMVAVAMIYVIVVTLLFRETHPCSFVLDRTKRISCATRMKLSLQLRSFSKTRFICYVFLISCGYTIGQFYALVLTLVTPILSDQFGFSVANTSHYLTGISVAFFGAFILQVAIKALKVDNRIMLGVALIMGLFGSLLVGDWQAIIRQDPCLSAHNVTDTTGFLANTTELENYDWIVSGSSSGSELNTSTNSSELMMGIDVDSLFSSGLMTDELNFTSNSSVYEQLIKSCEALSTSSHQCFWNPKSRVTGQFCNTCLPTCLSKQTAINFYQFSAGILLIALATPLEYVVVSAITSDMTATDSQGTALSLVLGSEAIGRIVSPIWFVESYEFSGKHTYPSMALTSAILLVLLLLLAVLYRSLAPRLAATVHHVNPGFREMELNNIPACEEDSEE